MTPRDQLRKMTALGEQGALDEKHWYRLVNGMSAGGQSLPGWILYYTIKEDPSSSKTFSTGEGETVLKNVVLEHFYWPLCPKMITHFKE